jgi:hypothetical protein
MATSSPPSWSAVYNESARTLNSATGNIYSTMVMHRAFTLRSYSAQIQFQIEEKNHLTQTVPAPTDKN